MSTTFTDRDYTEKMLQQLWRLRGSEELCDALLIAGKSEERISAHRCILSAASEYFRRVLDESTANEIKLPKLNGDVLNSLLEFCYTGHIVITPMNMEQLLGAATMLGLGNLESACADFLLEQLSPTNCLRYTMLLVERNECKTQLQKVRDYSLKHFMEIRGTDEFLQLKKEELLQLLGNDELAVPAEEDVFDGLMEWIQHDRTEREKHQAELLKLVRLPLMQKSFVVNRVKPECTSLECLEVYLEAIELYMPPQGELPKARKSVKPESLLAITHNSDAQYEKYIKFYCSQQCTWIEWPKSFTFHEQSSIAKIGDTLYILGGKNAEGHTMNDVMCLNIKPMHLGKVSQMTESRANCGAAVLEGFLYAVGGCSALGSALNSVEKFCPKTNKWIKVAPMKYSKSKMGLAVLNKKLYVIGCTESPYAFESYDPGRNEWLHIFSIRDDFSLTGQIAIANGRVCKIGTFEGKASVAWYDPDGMDKKGKIISVLPGELSSLFATGLWVTFGNKFIICHDNTIVEYDDVNNKWKTETSLGLQNLDFVFSYGDTLPDKFFCIPGT